METRGSFMLNALSAHACMCSTDHPVYNICIHTYTRNIFIYYTLVALSCPMQCRVVHNPEHHAACARVVCTPRRRRWNAYSFYRFFFFHSFFFRCARSPLLLCLLFIFVLFLYAHVCVYFRPPVRYRGTTTVRKFTAPAIPYEFRPPEAPPPNPLLSWVLCNPACNRDAARGVSVVVKVCVLWMFLFFILAVTRTPYTVPAGRLGPLSRRPSVHRRRGRAFVSLEKSFAQRVLHRQSSLYRRSCQSRLLENDKKIY